MNKCNKAKECKELHGRNIQCGHCLPHNPWESCNCGCPITEWDDAKCIELNEKNASLEDIAALVRGSPGIREIVEKAEQVETTIYGAFADILD
jgi:hypothetical protein